jgi:hypothetical protein
MSIYTLYIMNKSGGLVYNIDFPTKDQITTPKLNQRMQLGSTFHTFNAITSELAPNKVSNGIDCIEADTFKLFCLAAPTGTRFFCLTDPNAQNVQKKLTQIYDLYCDYVMKNPFYTYEQVIQCDLFEQNLKAQITN